MWDIHIRRSHRVNRGRAMRIRSRSCLLIVTACFLGASRSTAQDGGESALRHRFVEDYIGAKQLRLHRYVFDQNVEFRITRYVLPAQTAVESRLVPWRIDTGRTLSNREWVRTELVESDLDKKSEVRRAAVFSGNEFYELQWKP